jgi:hypothetical protein
MHDQIPEHDGLPQIFFNLNLSGGSVWLTLTKIKLARPRRACSRRPKGIPNRGAGDVDCRRAGLGAEPERLKNHSHEKFFTKPSAA